MFLTAISFILGAIWRRLDGKGGQFKGFHLLPLIAILPAFYFDWQLGFALLIAWVSLLDGFHGWTDWGYMSMRYTGYSALACTLAGVSPWYLLFGLISGLCYPLGAWIKKRYYNKFYYTKYCEYIAGGLMFGGLFMLT